MDAMMGDAMLGVDAIMGDGILGVDAMLGAGAILGADGMLDAVMGAGVVMGAGCVLDGDARTVGEEAELSPDVEMPGGLGT